MGYIYVDISQLIPLNSKFNTIEPFLDFTIPQDPLTSLFQPQEMQQNKNGLSFNYIGTI